MPTGIEFIERLREEWSAGAITREVALQRLLPWEDDLAIRTPEELEAAWALRQELETGATDTDASLGATAGTSTNGVSSESGTIEETGVEADANSRLQRRVADLRANPLISRDDLLAAHSLCMRLVGASEASGADANYIRTRCGEVEVRVARHVESVQIAIERASHLIESAPDMADKLQACESIREALADMETLRPDDPTLPDMIAWCEQTRHELTTLLARRDIIVADIEGLSTSEALDIGLVEGCKQRLIIMSDMQLSKDDLELRKAARALAMRLTDYMSSRLQPGATTAASKEEVEEYRRVLHLAKQAPEAISADQAKSYGDALSDAESTLPPAAQGSEPPTRSLPSVPPPQPRDTTGSQPNSAVAAAAGQQPGTTPAATPSSTTAPAFRPLQAPPAPPKVQPGWGSTSTQPVAGSGTIAPHGHVAQNVTPPHPHNTTSHPPTYAQPSHGYPPGSYRQPISPTVWVGIGVGIFVFVMLMVLIIALATNRGGGSGGGNTGGATGAGETARTFYVNLQRRDYQSAFSLLTSEFAAGLDVNTIRGRVEITENGQGAIQSINVSNVTETEDTARAPVTVGYGRGGQSTETFSLRKVGGRWLIANIT